MNALVEHWELVASIVVPVLTLAGTVGWAAGAYILKTNEKVLSELSIAIAELREQNKIMCDTYQKDMRSVVTKEYCRIESIDCNERRDIFRANIEKKIDEMHEDLLLQDQKRHDTNNKNHVCWMEIREKLATITTTLEFITKTYSENQRVLAERSNHEDRLKAIEKERSMHVNQGRRAGDVP